MRVFLAILLCKLSRSLLRLFKRGGTNLPGKIAVKICPDLLKTVAQGVRVTVITGTNGKTTTARMIEQAYINAGIPYFSNRSGANLLTGITAEFAVHASLSGKAKIPNAIIECDEGASAMVCRYANPSVFLLTNLFGDQLDRFGDIMHTLDCVKAGAENSPNARICLNADDSLSVSIADGLPTQPHFFGVETELYKAPTDEPSDAPDCIKCGTAYEYEYITYAHLGGFHCPNCGYSRPDTDTAIVSAEPGADGSAITIRSRYQEFPAYVNLPGQYNIYNAAAAAATLSALDFDVQAIIDALENFECGFGRMEKFELEGRDVRMILVKNTAGFNQVLNFLSSLEIDALFVICLNDRIADGTDVSWIWDVNFEQLAESGQRFLLSGGRADEMVVRLAQARIPNESVEVIREYPALLTRMLEDESPVYIMPTYTAMLELRDIISKKYGYKDFWE